jgi:plastocyanin
MGVISTQGFSFKLIANGTQLDLFDDEEILVSDNITGLFDIGVLPSDFTRQITVPGTKVNNAFFEHVYDISIVNPYLFATNTKVPCYLDFDGIYLADGYLQLNQVNVIGNKFIDSYEVTIFGGLSSFARDINRNFLTDLSTLSKYNHTASYEAISQSWNGGLFGGDIVYPLADYGSGYQFTQGQYQTFGMNTTNGALTVQNFKPAIRAKAVLDAIFEEAGYTYTSTFLEPYNDLPTVFTVTNNGSGNYVINGESNPTLTLAAGKTYTFNVNATGHPFWIKTTNSTGSVNAYNIGVTNNGTASGSITFTVPYPAPSSLYYNCQFHASMAGGIDVVKSVIDDVYMNCNHSLKYPEFAGIDLETYGQIKVGAVSGSTDIALPSDTFVSLPWSNALSDPQRFWNNNAYRVEKKTNLRGILNLNLNVSCSVNNMPGTFSANGTFQIQMIETGSSTAYSLRALQSYIIFFDQLQQSRTGGINTTYELQTEFVLDSIPAGNYYFQIKQRPNFASPTVQPTVTMDPDETTKSYIQITEVNQAADGRVMDIPSNMPYGTNGIKQIDFLTGLQKKFNLVIYPNKTKSSQFIIETFNDWYKIGEVKDFNKYINLDKKIAFIPANNLAVNELNFTDTLDTDYISQQFSKEANREYGKQYNIDTTNFFSQGKFEVKTTFGNGPLLRIPGTGLSGSVSGLDPAQTQFSIGTYKVSQESSAALVCDDFSTVAYYQLYTSTGTLQSGLIAYTDPYGNTPVTAFNYMVQGTGGGGYEVYSLNSITGQIGYGTGYFC